MSADIEYHGYCKLAAAVLAGVLRWNRREAIAEFLRCPLGAMWCAWLRLNPEAVERAVLEELADVEAYLAHRSSSGCDLGCQSTLTSVATRLQLEDSACVLRHSGDRSDPRRLTAMFLTCPAESIRVRLRSP